MRIIIRGFVLLILFLFCFENSNLRAQYVEFETSWNRAKKKSNKSGKPILAIFSHWKYSEMERNFLDVDSVILSLKNDFILYKHIRGTDEPWYIRGYPTIVISDHEGNRYKQMMYYYVKDSILDEISDFDKQKPWSFFEQNYTKNENALEFLEEYVRYALKYQLGLTSVYYDYYQRIEGFNCLKLKCVTQSLCYALGTEEYLDNYEEMKKMDCENDDIEDRLFTCFQSDFISIDIEDESRYTNYLEAAARSATFLNRDNRYRDSLVAFNTWHYYSKRYYERFTDAENNRANTLLLDCFGYKIEDKFERDSLQSMLFDLSISIDNRKELTQLAEIILNRPLFITDAAIVEILGIVYFRLGDNDNGVKMIARANDIAVKNRIRYRTVIPEMKQKGLLKVIEK